MDTAVYTFRAFGRAFAQRAGLLHEAPYDPSLTLVESRVLFELQQARTARAKDLAKRLAIDKGHLSRVIGSMRLRRLFNESPSSGDRRERWLSLTSSGERLFRRIDAVSSARAQAVLDSAGPSVATDLRNHLAAALAILDPRELQAGGIRLRDLKSGDLGWVIERHGEIYRREFGWNADFEVLVAEIATRFTKTRTSRERAWVAEAAGVRLGCVFLVRESEHTAKLRILLVEPMARGLGLGSRLVRECLAFAKKARYRRVVLWTNSVLVAARRIYEANGFALQREEKHHSFGKNLVGQYWAKDL